ncbi:MAG: hypothetical protein GF387_00450 [Candidatus Portnoybacteria bacterium]|nr:hypothetical protein [Candidatus Portnoybacteria bacterium]
MKNLYRHGDLLIKQIKELPKKLKAISGGTLALGEATGHHHTIVADKQALQLFEDTNGNKYFSLTKPAPLTHQEHKTIEIETGYYRVDVEKEFDPFTEEMNNVRD